MNFKTQTQTTKTILFYDGHIYQRSETITYAFDTHRTVILWQQKNPSSGYLNKLSPELQIKFEKEYQNQMEDNQK